MSGSRMEVIPASCDTLRGRLVFGLASAFLTLTVLSSGCQRFSKPDTIPPPEDNAQEVLGTEGEATAEDAGKILEPSLDSTSGSHAGAGPDAPPEQAPAAVEPRSDEASSPVETPPAALKDPFQQAVENMRAGPSKYPLALKQLDEALATNPRLAEAYFDKGVILQELGDLDGAVKAYQKALEVKPTLGVAVANLATIYRDQGQVTRSIEVLDAGLAASPDSALLHRHRALSLERMGRVSEATEEIRKILKINAIDVDAFVTLGCMYLRQGDYEMGRLVFEKALLSVPGADNNAYVHHNLGVAFLALEDRRATKQFDLALDAKPDLVPALVDRAYLYLKIQHYQEAAALLKRAVDVDPDSVVARMNLGVALRGLKDYEGAAAQYESALTHAPDDPGVLLNYAILLDDYRRDYASAIAMYQRLRGVVEGDEEIARVDKYIRIAKLNLQREERRRKRELERQRAEERAPEPTPPASRGDAGGSSEASDAAQESPPEGNRGDVAPAGGPNAGEPGVREEAAPTHDVESE